METDDFGPDDAFDDEDYLFEDLPGDGDDQDGGNNPTEAAQATGLPVNRIDDVSSLFPNARPDLFPVVFGCGAQARVSCGVDLRHLSCGTRTVEFIPKKNAAAIMRINEPPCACIIRTSGSIFISGAQSPGAAKLAAELCVRIIRRVLDLQIDSFEFRVCSLMARFNLKHPLRLDKIHKEFPNECSFEPDRFCACIINLGKNQSWKVTANVYVTGKVIMVGARTMEELSAAFYTLLPMLSPHKGA